MAAMDEAHDGNTVLYNPGDTTHQPARSQFPGLLSMRVLTPGFVPYSVCPGGATLGLNNKVPNEISSFLFLPSTNNLQPRESVAGRV